MEILLPGLAKLAALQQELGRQQSIGRTPTPAHWVAGEGAGYTQCRAGAAG